MEPSSGAGIEAEPLTARQREVLDLIAKGYTNPQIADALWVSIDGAKWHVREILSKLGVESREEAADWWRRERSARTRIRRAIGGVGASMAVRWVAGGLVAVAAAGLGMLAATGGEEPDPGSPTPGQSGAQTVCGARIDQAHCDAVSWILGEASAGRADELLFNGDVQTYTCANGFLPGREYATVCEGAFEGLEREGYPVAYHGSHGGAEDVESIGKKLDDWLYGDGGFTGPDGATVGCPVAEPDCAEFVVVLRPGPGTSGPEAMYFTFRLDASGPRMTGAGFSGDNARTLLGGGETMSLLGPTRFVPLDAGALRATWTPTPEATAAPTAAAWDGATRTGVEAVDRVIAKVLDPDVAGIEAILNPQDYPCREVLGAQPGQGTVCRAGQTEGDINRGIWAGSVEGGIWDEESAAEGLTEALVRDHPGLFAVYHLTTHETGDFVQGDYAVVLAHDGILGPEYTTLYIVDGGIVGVAFTFPPLDFTNPAVEWVLPPPDVPIPGAARVRIPGDCLNVRAAPGLTSEVIACAADGILLQQTGEEVQADGISWTRVRTPGGVEGWASAAYLVE